MQGTGITTESKVIERFMGGCADRDCLGEEGRFSMETDQTTLAPFNFLSERPL